VPHKDRRQHQCYDCGCASSPKIRDRILGEPPMKMHDAFLNQPFSILPTQSHSIGRGRPLVLLVLNLRSMSN
jgi:hypothetical protein